MTETGAHVLSPVISAVPFLYPVHLNFNLRCSRSKHWVKATQTRLQNRDACEADMVSLCCKAHCPPALREAGCKTAPHSTQHIGPCPLKDMPRESSLIRGHPHCGPDSAWSSTPTQAPHSNPDLHLGRGGSSLDDQPLSLTVLPFLSHHAQIFYPSQLMSGEPLPEDKSQTMLGPL